MTHTSACAVHNTPAGPCDCGEWARETAKRLYIFLVSDGKGFSVPMRRDIELAEQAIAEALYDAHNDGIAAGLSARKEELDRLYEWKRQAEDMDKRKTVEIVSLRDALIAAERAGRARGMRDAAEILSPFSTLSQVWTGLELLRTRADAISRGDA